MKRRISTCLHRQLGVERFAELYGQGFLNGEGYDSMPLEAMAYSLVAAMRSRHLVWNNRQHVRLHLVPLLDQESL